MTYPLYASDNNIWMWLNTIHFPEWCPQSGCLADAVASSPPLYVTLLHAVAPSCSQEVPDSLSKGGKGHGAGSDVSNDEDEASKLVFSVGDQRDESTNDQLCLGTNQGLGRHIWYVSVIVPSHGQLKAPEEPWKPVGKRRSKIAGHVRKKPEETIVVDNRMLESLERG